jgi:hypothetical protein
MCITWLLALSPQQPARSSLLHKFTEQQAVLLKHSRVYVQETERIKVRA